MKLPMLLCLSLLMLMVAGCRTPGIFAIKPDDGKSEMMVLAEKSLISKRVAVASFTDSRNNDNTAGTDRKSVV